MAAEKIDALQLDINSKLNTENIDALIKKLGELANALDKLKSKSVSVNINKTGSAVNSLTSSFLKSAVSITAVIAAFRKLSTTISDGIANSATYIKTLNMFNTSLGQYADNATKYGQTVSEALGIDIASWQNTQGVFDTLIKGMGVTGEKAAYMSQNLTQLAYDISTFYGITTEEAANKLKSAMAGRTQPVRTLGYSVDQAQAVDYAQNPKNYGKQTFAINQQTGAIEANTVATDTNTQHKIVNFNQLLSSEKAIIRYNLLMTENTQVQGNFARALNDPYNQMRIFKDQLNQTSRAFGNMFIPVLNKVLPYLSAFAQLATEAFQSLAQLFGFKLPDMKDRAKIDTKPYDHVVKATGKAAKNTQKMKDYMLGIDELNVFNPNTGAGAGGGSGAKGQNSNLKNMKLQGYDFLGKAVENSIKEAKKKIRQFFSDLKKNPFLLDQIFVWGASKLGENVWEWLLGKSPEQFAADAQKHSFNFGEEFCYSFYKGFNEHSSDLVELFVGSPDELGKRAAEAGRTVGEQFKLELLKKGLELFNSNPIMKFLYEKTSGRNLEKDIAVLQKAVNKKSDAGYKNEKSQGYVSYDEAKKLSEIQNNGKVKTKALTIMNTSAAEAQKQGERYANGYAKGLTSKKTAVQNAANEGVYKPAYNGATNSGNANSMFKFVATNNARNYASGLGSQNSATKAAGNSLYQSGYNGATNSGNGASQFRYVSAEEAKAYGKGLSSQNGTTKTAGDGLFKSGYNGANKNGTATSKYKYVSAEMAKTYANNLGSKTAKTNTYNAASNVAGQGVKGEESKIGGYKKAGQNSTKGYIDGVLKYIKQTGAAGAAIGAAALKALEKKLKTGSPSKAAAKIGAYTAQGYANGITQNTSLVTRSVQNMAGEALDAMSNASKISNSIITGGAISVSTSANAGYGIGAANGMAMESLASNIYQAVVSGISNASANTESSDIKVIIDGKEVFKAVQAESRKRGVAVSNGIYSR